MRLRTADFMLMVWVALWVGLAVAVFHEVRGLEDVSDTLVRTGRAADDTGRALQTLSDLPFVGGRIKGYAGNISRAGRSAERSGRSSKGHIENLAVLLALVVGLVPTVPTFVLYLALRSAWRRGSLAAQVGVS